ncbi:hypothetical protein [Leptolyngbya sp. KIOST-1]|uniref:hypothetical protein n=1 Tax=Leptolyngbya sp. KIOST-1 TaxID=1229172 RepID=UPI0012E0A1BD|nr:hypothetical protein [Leptolyngbya sp. KIOST-1]
MSMRPWVQPFSTLGTTFWLLLPLAGGLFWLVGMLVTEQVLHRSDRSAQLFPTEPLGQDQGSDIRLIRARVDRSRGLTEVAVNPSDRQAQSVAIELETAYLDEVERQIARALNLSPVTVQRLTQYTIHDPLRAQREPGD